jgi:hypothetical protein
LNLPTTAYLPSTMKATSGFLAAFALEALAVPLIPVEEKSPYLMPGPVLGSDKINILKPITGSGDASPRKPPKDGYRDLKLKKDIALAWKNGKYLTYAECSFVLAPKRKMIHASGKTQSNSLTDTCPPPI